MKFGISSKVLSLLTCASVAAMVAGTAHATVYRLETHGYLDHGKFVVTSSKVTDLSKQASSRTKPTYTVYSAAYASGASTPLKIATAVAQIGYFTNTTSNACLGIPKGKFKVAVPSDVNGKWSAKTLPAATVPYTSLLPNGATCTGGVITNFHNSEVNYAWTNATAAVGATDVSTAVYTVKALDWGSTTEGFSVIDTYTNTATYCGKPAKGTKTCPTP